MDNTYDEEKFEEFLDQLEEIEELEEDDDEVLEEDVIEEDEEDEEPTYQIIPKKKNKIKSPSSKAGIISKAGSLLGGLSIGFGNGSGISFSDQGIGINVTKETIQDVSYNLTKMQNRKLKNKVKKLKKKK